MTTAEPAVMSRHEEVTWKVALILLVVVSCAVISGLVWAVRSTVQGVSDRADSVVEQNQQVVEQNERLIAQNERLTTLLQQSCVRENAGFALIEDALRASVVDPTERAAIINGLRDRLTGPPIEATGVDCK